MTPFRSLTIDLISSTSSPDLPSLSPPPRLQAEETVRSLEALLEQARIRGVHLEASLKVRAASLIDP